MVKLDKVTDYKHNTFVVRPTYKQWGVYEIVGINKARVVFESTKESCEEYFKRIMYMKYNS